MQLYHDNVHLHVIQIIYETQEQSIVVTYQKMQLFINHEQRQQNLYGEIQNDENHYGEQTQ